MVNQIKNCLACGDPLRGRSDKKFCDDQCRNQHNNQQKARRSNNPSIKTINQTLLRNREILESLLPEGGQSARISRERLQQEGFLFKYMTHALTNNRGKTFYYCYDYGYRPLQNDGYLLVRN